VFVNLTNLPFPPVGVGMYEWWAASVTPRRAAPTRELRAVPVRHSSQFKNHHSTEMCSGSEAGSYLRLTDSCITQLKDLLGPVTREKKKKGVGMYEWWAASVAPRRAAPTRALHSAACFRFLV